MHGQQRVAIAFVANLGVPCMQRDLLLDPIPVFFSVAGVDHEHETVRGQTVHQHVVHNASCIIGHATVLNLAVFQYGSIVGADPLNQLFSVGSFHHEFTHVADIKHADVLSHCLVFELESLVLHRHVVSRKRDHLGACLQMGLMKGGGLQWGRFHGAKVARQLRARGEE